MLRHLRYRKQSRIWQDRFGPLAPKVGDVAPDFKVKDLSGEHSASLSDFRGQRPAALIFGSFT